MHTLFFATAIDRHNARIDHNNHANYQVMVLQNAVGHERYQVQSFVLTAIKFNYYNQQVSPREAGTSKKIYIFILVCKYFLKLGFF